MNSRTGSSAKESRTLFTIKSNGPKNKLYSEGRASEAASREYLVAMDADNHNGFPPDMFGFDLNYDTLKRQTIKADSKFFEEIRQMNNSVDDKLRNFLGARFAALKAYYPKDGYIAWHTNWNAAGYNIIFTYSEGGDGYWRHIDPENSKSHKPDVEKMVHIQDKPGWHCKVGYFGTKQETDKIVWHSAYTNEPRLTMSYIIYDEALWTSMVEDIEAK